MKQKDVLVLKKYEQLKSLSDPLRVQILSLLIEETRSGQDLSKIMDISRSKIHYHLQDLEKNGLIKMVEENKKRNMTQKLYQAIAKSYIPATELLPFQEEYGESRRLLTISTLDRAKNRVLAAPDSVFFNQSENPKEWSRISTQTEVRTTKEQFKNWVAKYHQLMDELHAISEPDKADSDWFYIATVGIQIDEPYFKDQEDDE